MPPNHFRDWAQTHLSPVPQRYHVTPVCLVPNGRAHLGHIAGPLLKADVLNRSLQVAGHESLMISCTDPDELHVVIKAMSRGEDPEAMAEMFCAEIRADFASIDIAFDDYIDPHHADWRPMYDQINTTLVDDLLANGQAAIRSEKMPVLLETGEGYVAAPFVPKPGDYLTGGWISGACNWCDARLVGFFCEACGAHCNHEDVADKASVYFEARFEERDCDSVFLRPDDVPAVLAHLDAMAFSPEFRKIVTRYIDSYDGAIRLTLPSEWGVRYTHPELTGDHVVFTYSGVLYACHILAGEAHRRLTGGTLNALDKASEVINILTFGIDNTVPFAYGATALGLTNPRYKPIDRFYANHFYNLDGAKFSTSRGHVIWGRDIAGLDAVNTDFLRLYLVETAPEKAAGNFDLGDFVTSYNRTAQRVRQILDRLAAAGPSPAQDDTLAQTWLSGFARTFALDGFDMRRVATFTNGVLDDLAGLAADDLTPDLVKLAAITLHPVMPRLSGWLWRHSGQDGAVCLRNAIPAVFARDVQPTPLCDDIALTTLADCLPQALKEARGL